MCGNNQEVLKSLFPLLTKKLFPLRLIAEIIQNLESRCCGERHWEGKAGEWKGETGPLTDRTLSKRHTESSLANMDCGGALRLGYQRATAGDWTLEQDCLSQNPIPAVLVAWGKSLQSTVPQLSHLLIH